MKALGSFVEVELIEEKSEGLIEYETKKDYSKAKVLSVGEKVDNIKKDDTIYFARDCIKLVLDNKINIIDAKYIVAKD